MEYAGPRRNVALKAAIFKSGMSQLKVAEKAGMNDGWLSLIITGRVNPTQEEFERILAALGVSKLIDKLSDEEKEYFGIPSEG